MTDISAPTHATAAFRMSLYLQALRDRLLRPAPTALSAHTMKDIGLKPRHALRPLSQDAATALHLMSLGHHP